MTEMLCYFQLMIPSDIDTYFQPVIPSNRNAVLLPTHDP